MPYNFVSHSTVIKHTQRDVENLCKAQNKKIKILANNFFITNNINRKLCFLCNNCEVLMFSYDNYFY